MRRCFDAVTASVVMAAVGVVGLADGQDTATTEAEVLREIHAFVAGLAVKLAR
jgi:hypothetical protein